MYPLYYWIGSTSCFEGVRAHGDRNMREMKDSGSFCSLLIAFTAQSPIYLVSHFALNDLMSTRAKSAWPVHKRSGLFFGVEQLMDWFKDYCAQFSIDVKDYWTTWGEDLLLRETLTLSHIVPLLPFPRYPRSDKFVSLYRKCAHSADRRKLRRGEERIPNASISLTATRPTLKHPLLTMYFESYALWNLIYL